MGIIYLTTQAATSSRRLAYSSSVKSHPFIFSATAGFCGHFFTLFSLTSLFNIPQTMLSFPDFMACPGSRNIPARRLISAAPMHCLSCFASNLRFESDSKPGIESRKDRPLRTFCRRSGDGGDFPLQTKAPEYRTGATDDLQQASNAAADGRFPVQPRSRRIHRRSF